MLWLVCDVYLTLIWFGRNSSCCICSCMGWSQVLHIYINIHTPYTCVYAWMHVWLSKHMGTQFKCLVHVYVYTHIQLYAYTHTHTLIHTCADRCVNASMCAVRQTKSYIYIYIWIYKYIYIYIYNVLIGAYMSIYIYIFIWMHAKLKPYYTHSVNTRTCMHIPKYDCQCHGLYCITLCYAHNWMLATHTLTIQYNVGRALFVLCKYKVWLCGYHCYNYVY